MPRIIGLRSLAISSKGLRFLWISMALNFSSIAVLDLILTKLPGISLHLLFSLTMAGLMVKPRKSYFFGYFSMDSPLRFTIFVLTGCSSSLQAFIRCSICLSINKACFSVLQCTTMSSAYRSKGFSGWFFSIHWSIATCRKRLASNGLMTPPLMFGAGFAVCLPLFPKIRFGS